MIVAGERRFRAAQRAGLDKIPVLVRTLSNQHKLELSLIENLQRRDLSPQRRPRRISSCAISSTSRLIKSDIESEASLLLQSATRSVFSVFPSRFAKHSQMVGYVRVRLVRSSIWT